MTDQPAEPRCEVSLLLRGHRVLDRLNQGLTTSTSSRTMAFYAALSKAWDDAERTARQEGDYSLMKPEFTTLEDKYLDALDTFEDALHGSGA